MTSAERRTGSALAAIFGLRMLGLFLVLPVFSVLAAELPGGNDLMLVGLALGAYGLTQAFFQIPFGLASDRWGRKPVIVAGLLLFAAGSFIAATAPDIYWMIAGRVLQGAGAISAAVSALAADLTREQHRTKVMAMIGASIGLVFALSLVIAPPLAAAIGLSGLFVLTGALALGAIILLFTAVPPAPTFSAPARGSFLAVLLDPKLARLNFGVFALHLMQMALWMVVPATLISSGGLPGAEHWKIYLPAVLLSLALMVPAIIAAEKHGKLRPIYAGAVALLVLVQVGFAWFAGDNWGLWGIGLWLLLFFVAFNILEALLPSLISRLAPPAAKGAALGIYNTTQSLGLFLGGILGGWLVKNFGPTAVHLVCAAVGIIWLGLAVRVTAPPRPAEKVSS
ncbi:MAG: MFS transporter [Gammaproteobacteria bacterium]|nr:MFS transporter [Rhodocyclaceae bacterium]MBU3910536.1 MFS transporter [Gammaproteobacteria bacterium]MBU3989074.1 MFS transporter [Gammaproteobacteria bacterium]MBU4005017.1 MFS transporter [Gammaproteobacteria bacterium]MBU4020610.1 MFS transporter [Gammaproteobacteria bacterium]